ncbi:MAG TPA: hypothetical protein VER55_16070, partial [Ardenticatenaceae bacterium]|nr:hypothetical protein [Ardenticatenaceae bacterium]
MDSAAAISASAPAKIILLGEHAVVYGQPAIALPLSQRRATALVQPGSAGTGVVLHAADLGRQYLLDAAPAEDPLAVTVRNVLRRLGLDDEPDIRVSVTST